MKQLLRRYRWGVVLVLVGVALALISGAPSSPPPLSPTSTTADGTKALVLLLGRLGVTVRTGGAQARDGGPALMLQDQLNQDDRNSLMQWVEQGHTLVTADPTSQVAGVTADTDEGAQLTLNGGGRLAPGACPLPSVASVTSIEPEGGTLLVGHPGWAECFTGPGGAYLQAFRAGQGVVVVLGGPGLWTNANLGRVDNSVLAADLLVPAGASEVTVLGASRVGGGRTGLLGLVSPHVRELLWQLAVAFVLLGLWRARRLGQPVIEPTAVVIPASELVAARANLLQEGRHRGRAAAILRGNFARRAARRLGVAGAPSPASIASAAVDRAGVSESVMLDLLAGADPASDEDLVRLAQEIDDTLGEIARAE